MNYIIITISIIVIFIIADQLLKFYLKYIINRIMNTLENFLCDENI